MFEEQERQDNLKLRHDFFTKNADQRGKPFFDIIKLTTAGGRGDQRKRRKGKKKTKLNLWSSI